MRRLLKPILILFIGMGLYDPIYGQHQNQDHAICEIYKSHAWLPEAYCHNAFAACHQLEGDTQANIARQTLIQLLSTTDSGMIRQAMDMKKAFTNGELGKHKYNQYVKKQLVPLIQNHHVLAYKQAQCPSGPAPTWVWKKACTRKFNNPERMFWRGMYFGSNCHNRTGRW
jgi:hypothetical protein